MPISTPLRKRAMADLDGIQSPLRRSVCFAATSSPLERSIVNDDEAERSSRRHYAVQQKRVSSINSSGQNESKELSGKELQDHFETCLKMFTENKINTKNAWSLHIIDFMRTMLAGQGQDTLQLASTTLDVSSKVYGLRVDDLHDQTLKLTSMLSRFKQNTDDPESNEANNSVTADEQDPDKQKKSRSKRRGVSHGQKTTVVTNDELLNGEVETYDPNIVHMSTSDDNKRLMTVSSHKEPCGYTLTLDASNFLSWHNVASVQLPQSYVPVVLPQQLGSLVPPELDGLTVDDWSPDSENSLHNTSRDKVVYDKDGLPIPAMDSAGPDEFDCAAAVDLGGDASDDEDRPADDGGMFTQEVIQIRDLRPVLDSCGQEFEYCYRRAPSADDGRGISAIWAGPAHWKLKCLRQSNVSSARTERPQPQRRKNQRRSVNNPLRFDVEDAPPLSHYEGRRCTAKVTCLSYQQCTFPENMLIERRSRRTLMLKPAVSVRQLPIKAEASHIDLNVSNYEHDNPNDSEYCSQTIVDNGWDGQNDDAAAGADTAAGADATLAGTSSLPDNDLITAPRLVQKSNLYYATQAKKIDMKKLKAAIWDEFNHNTSQNPLPQEEHTRFSDIYSKLPLKLSEEMAEELNKPMALVALLHLATENSLTLTSSDNLKDLVVSKE